MKKKYINKIDRIGLASIYKQMPFMYFLAALGLIYIMVAHKMERKMRKITALKIEVKEERSRFLSTKSTYMFKSTRSELEKKGSKEGLMNDPSNVYVIKSKTDESEN